MPTLHLDTIELNALLGPPVDRNRADLTARLHELDGDLWVHAEWVARTSEIVARRIGLETIERATVIDAAWLHDLGKLTIPHRILDKPGPLDELEWVEMRSHAARGAEYLAQGFTYEPLVPLVRHHHERFDGHGYPAGMVGVDIPLGARIICVVDAFDAMTTDRPYRCAIPALDAFGELERCAQTQFDPAVVEAFMAVAPEIEKGSER
jgi:HD-GYP domain-containing protein (c-di-GMP phosphodiesterase class II)